MTAGIPGVPRIPGAPGVPGTPGVPGGDLLQSLTGEIPALVRREVRAAMQDFLSPFRETRAGARMLGGSAVLGSMAAGSATALAIRALDRWLPPTVSTAVVAAAFGAGASALGAAARARMRQAWTPTP